MKMHLIAKKKRENIYKTFTKHIPVLSKIHVAQSLCSVFVLITVCPVVVFLLAIHGIMRLSYLFAS
jgi:hypothetical protein